jgi:hypothetical protein
MKTSRFFALRQSTIDLFKKTPELSLASLSVFLVLNLNADAKTGIYLGCAATLAAQCADLVNERVVRGLLAELENAGLIRRYGKGSRSHSMAIDGYLCTHGDHEHRYVNLAKSGKKSVDRVAYVDENGLTEEETTLEPHEVVSAVATSVASHPRHPMTEWVKEAFLKWRGTTAEESHLRELDEYLTARPENAEILEGILAYAALHKYWSEKIQTVDDLVFRLTSNAKLNLVKQYKKLGIETKKSLIAKAPYRATVAPTSGSAGKGSWQESELKFESITAVKEEKSDIPHKFTSAFPRISHL